MLQSTPTVLGSHPRTASGAKIRVVYSKKQEKNIFEIELVFQSPQSPNISLKYAL